MRSHINSVGCYSVACESLSVPRSISEYGKNSENLNLNKDKKNIIISCDNLR